MRFRPVMSSKGGMLVLAPEVLHDVKAEEKTLMLLTVRLGNE